MEVTSTPKESQKDHADLCALYQEVSTSYHGIDDFRGKLLGLLPLASGAGIFLLLRNDITNESEHLLAVGLFGAVVTLGLFVYELRGLQRCQKLIDLGRSMEAGLEGAVSGPFTQYPAPLVGVVGAGTASFLIYSAVIAAWLYVAFTSLWIAGIGFLGILSVFTIFAHRTKLWA